MTTITPGTGGTIKSTTLENAFHEALTLCIGYERDTAKNPSNLRNITLSINLADNKATGTFSFGLTKEISATGSITHTTAEYLTNTAFASGTGGTIVSNTIASAILEIAERIQTLEANSLKNPTAIQQITGITYDSEQLSVSGTFDYAVVSIVDATGKTVISAKPYLVD